MGHYIPVVKSILLTGGIGDVLALETFFSNEQRNNLETIYYATRAHRAVREIFDVLPNYPRLKRHVILWEDFSRIFAFHSKTDLLEKMNPYRGNTQEDWDLRISRYNRWCRLLEPVGDYSIAIMFPQCNSHFRPFNESSVLKHQVTTINKFCLPGNAEFVHRAENQPRVAHLMTLGVLSQPLNFIVICPYTINDRRDQGRDFNEDDWQFVKNYLERRKCFGVVLNIGHDPIPDHPLIINMSNKTTLMESIEILKQAKGYVGIDSCLSVLAAKMFSYPSLLVKSSNGHCYVWAGVYYAPHDEQPFLMRAFQGP